MLLEAEGRRPKARRLGRRPPALAGTGPEARGAPPAPARVLRRLVSHRLALSQQRETLKARQTLQGIMRLTPTVGSPEMKAKYEALLARLSKK